MTEHFDQRLIRLFLVFDLRMGFDVKRQKTTACVWDEDVPYYIFSGKNI